MTDEVLATITPSRFRRGLAVALLAGLGALLMYLGFNDDSIGYGLRMAFAGLGTGGLVLAERVWRLTAVSLILTEAGLLDSNGRVLCLTEEVAHVERNAFAFKPSNGFAVKLTRPAARAWVPGLWWRYGRRLGVGGVVSKHEAKAMADVMALRLRMASEG